MADITSAGIGIKIIWPTNTDIDSQINKIQSYLNTKDLNLKMTIPDNVMKGLEQIGRMAQISATQVDKLGQSLNNAGNSGAMNKTAESFKVFDVAGQKVEKLISTTRQYTDELGRTVTEAQKFKAIMNEAGTGVDTASEIPIITYGNNLEATRLKAEKLIITQEKLRATMLNMGSLPLSAQPLATNAETLVTGLSPNSSITEIEKAKLAVQALTNAHKELQTTQSLEGQQSQAIAQTTAKYNQLFNEIRAGASSVRLTEEQMTLLQQKLSAISVNPRALTQLEELKALMASMSSETNIQFVTDRDLENARLKTAELKRQIALYQEQIALQIRNVQSQFGASSQTPAMQASLGAVQSSANGLNATALNSNEYRAQTAQINSSLSSVRTSLNETRAASDNFGTDMQNNLKKMVEWTVMGGLIFGAMSQVKQAFSFIADVNKNLSIMQMEMTNTSINFKEITADSNGLAISMGTTTQNVIAAIQVFANYNSTMTDTMERSKAAILLSNLTGKGITDSSNSILAMENQFGYAANQSEHMVDILAATARTLQIDYPVAIQQVSSGIEKVGSLANQAKVPLESLASMIGVTAEKTRLSGDTIGQAYKTIFSRISNVGDESDPESFKKIEKSFYDIGVAIKSDATTIRPLNEVLTDLAGTWSTLNDVQKNQIATDSAGIRQKNIFIATMDSWNQISDNTTQAMDSQGVASQKNDIYMQSLNAHVQQFKATWQQLYMNLSDSDGLKGIVDTGTKVIGVFGNVSSVLGTIPTLLATIVLAGSAFSTKFRTMIAGSLIGSTAGFISSLRLIGSTITQIGNMRGISTMSATLTVLRASFIEVGWAAIGAKIAMVGFHVVATLGLSLAISGMISLFTNWTQKTEDQKKSFEDLIKSIASLKQETAEASGLADEYAKLSKQTALTTEEKTKLTDISQRLASLFPDLITGYDSEGKALLGTSEAIQQAITDNKALLKSKQDLVSDQFKVTGTTDFGKLQEDQAKSSSLHTQKTSALKVIDDTKSNGTQFDENGYDTLKSAKNEVAGIDKELAILDPKIIESTKSLSGLADSFVQSGDSAKSLGVVVARTLISDLSKLQGEGKITSDQFTTIFDGLKNSDFSQKLSDAKTNLSSLSTTGASATTIQVAYNKVIGDLSPYLISLGKDGKEAGIVLRDMLSLPSAQEAKVKLDAIAESVSSIITSTKDSQDAIKSYNQILFDQANGTQMSAEKAVELISANEKMAGAISIVNGAVVINTDVVKELRRAEIDLINTKISGSSKSIAIQISDAEGVISATALRVAEIDREIAKVRELESARYNASSTDEKSNYNAEHIHSQYDTQKTDDIYASSTAKAELARLKSLQTLQNAIGSSDYGVSSASEKAKQVADDKKAKADKAKADKEAKAKESADKKALADAQKQADAVARAQEKVAIATKRLNDAKTISQKESALDALNVANANLEAVNKAGATAESIAQARTAAINADSAKASTNAIAEIARVQKATSDAIIAGYQAQIDAVNTKVATETRATQQLQYQNDLIRQQNDLTNTQNQKNVRIFQDGKWQWQADQTAVQSARDAVSTTQTASTKFNADNAIADLVTALNLSIKTEQDAQAQREKSASASLSGYASGTSYARSGVKKINEEGIEIIVGNKADFQGGEQVINASDTSKILNGSANTSSVSSSLNGMGQSLASSADSVKKPLDILLFDINANIQKFVDSSPKYARESNDNIGKSIKDNDILIKRPLDTLITDMSNSLQLFVNNSSEYGKNTDKNMGDAITANNALLITPMIVLVDSVKAGLNAFVADSYNSGIGIVSELGRGVTDSTEGLTDIVKVLTDKVVEQFRSSFGIHSPSVVMYKIGEFLMKGLANGISSNDINSFIQNQFTSMASSGQSVVGGAVSGNVRDWIAAAIKATGIDGSNASALEQMAMHESGGDPSAINNWDSNAMAGHPSQGLMQTIPSTFNAYKMAGHDDILNPIDNAIAAINYMISRYGSVNNVPGVKALTRGKNYVGYASGTEYVPKDGVYRINEDNKSEIVTLPQGAGVIKNSLTKNLMDWGKFNPNNFLKSILPKYKMPELKFNNQNQATQKSDTYITVQNVELPNVSDSEGFINSIMQLGHVTA